MNIAHHPEEDLLLDYSTGALGEAWSVAIATHLALCPDCRREVARIETIGGNLMEELPPAPLSSDSLESVLARLDDAEPVATPSTSAISATASRYGLPQPLRGYVENAGGEIDWQRLGLNASQRVLKTREDGSTARLLRIAAGKPVPTHSHSGLELTLVLSGAFSDETGRYARGDLQQADDTLEHRPHADPGEDCICLAVTEAPLRFKSVAAKIAQPFLGI